MNELAPYISQIELELNRVEIPSTPNTLYDPLRYFLKIGGKRIRPALALLAAELFTGDGKKAMSQAIAIEVFHNFTLIHDDIMDESPLRRGNETVHKKWDTNTAILSGDALLIMAYRELAKSNNESLPELLSLFNITALEVCEGQQMDMDFEERSDVSTEEYIEMIRLKTSVLLGCALEFGAIVSNASDKDRKAIYDFGQHIGIAFQIRDDVLDLYADPDKFGKQVGGDVLENKKTLLYLTAVSMASAEQREIFKQLENENNPIVKIKRTKEIFNSLGVQEACQQEMNKHYHKAMASLNSIDASEDRKSMLRKLAHYLIEREV